MYNANFCVVIIPISYGCLHLVLYKITPSGLDCVCAHMQNTILAPQNYFFLAGVQQQPYKSTAFYT